MVRVFILVAVSLVLNACTGTIQTLPAESVDDLRNKNTVVVFVDDVEQIKYTEDVYLVLAVAKVASNSAYKGIWKSNNELSAIHAAELTRIGMRATSLFSALPEEEAEAYIAKIRNTVAASRPKTQDDQNSESQSRTSSTPVALVQYAHPEFRALLKQKGFEYLIWIRWLGYRIHLPTLGLPPRANFATRYEILDLGKNKVIWQGSTYESRKPTIDGISGKEFLEKNNLAGLKSEITTMIVDRYRSQDEKKIRVGQMIGLEPMK